jgi:hypothetical protein
MDTIAPIDTVTVKMIRFVEEIGLPVRLIEIDEPTFLPGITLKDGGVVIDPEKLLYPGDILHEAGHLAVMPTDMRSKVNGTLATEGDTALGEEMMAMAWSYAACVYLEIDPTIVFHADGYHGTGCGIAANFSKGHYFAVPMLQWIGLCNEPKKIPEPGVEYYPKMMKWLRE